MKKRKIRNMTGGSEADGTRNRRADGEYGR